MKNKILPILCIFILISFIFINNNVFATETNTLIVDGYDMSDIYNYYSADEAFFIYIAPGTTSYYFYKPAYISEYTYNSVREDLIVYCTSSWTTNVGGHDFYSFNTETLKFNYGWHGNLNKTGHTISNMEIVYASKGIYNTDKETFFFKTPVTEQPETTPETVEIPAVETVEQIPTAMVETLKMIIPVGLVVLSVLLLIYLVRLVIYHFS